MDDLKQKTVTSDEVAEFYKRFPAFWFLLEVLDTDANGKAARLRVINYNKNKDALRDYLLDESFSADSQYIFVYADPDGKCDL